MTSQQAKQLLSNQKKSNDNVVWKITKSKYLHHF